MSIAKYIKFIPPGRKPESGLEKAINTILIAISVLVIFVVSPVSEDQFRYPKEMVALSGIMLVIILLFIELLRKNQLSFIPSSIIIPLVIFVIVILISFLLSPLKKFICYDTFSVILYLLFLIIFILYDKPLISVRQLSTLIVITSSFTAIYCLLQFFNLDPIFKSVGEFKKEASLVGGFIGNPNNVAGFLAIGAPLVLTRLLQASNLSSALVNFLSFLLHILAIISAGSRSITLITAFTSLLILISYISLAPIRQRVLKIFRSVSLFAFIFSLITIFFFVPSPLQWPGLHSQTVQYRLFIYRNTIKLIQKNPLFGNGIGSFKLLYPQAHIEAIKNGAVAPEIFKFTSVEQAHNDYLQLASECGIIGILSLIWIMAIFIKKALMKIKNERVELKIYYLGILTAVIASLLNALINFPFHIVPSALFTLLLSTLLIRNERAIPSVKTFHLFRMTISLFLLLFIVSISFFFSLMVRAFLADAFFAKGYSRLLSGDLKSARDYFQKGIKISDTYWQNYMGMGMVLNGMGEFAQAQKYLQYAFPIASKIHIIHLLYAVSLQGTNQFLSAEDHIRRALLMNPNFEEAKQLLKENLTHRMSEAFKNQDQELFKKLLFQAFADFPDDPYFNSELGYLFIQSGDYNKAEECFILALKKDPKNWRNAYGLAQVEEASGKYEEAALWYEWALKWSNNSSLILEKMKNLQSIFTTPFILSTYGRMLLSSGLLDQAENEFSLALSWDKNHLPALEGMVEINYARANLNRAIFYLERILNLNPQNKYALGQISKLFVNALNSEAHCYLNRYVYAQYQFDFEFKNTPDWYKFAVLNAGWEDKYICIKPKRNNSIKIEKLNVPVELFDRISITFARDYPLIEVKIYTANGRVWKKLFGFNKNTPLSIPLNQFLNKSDRIVGIEFINKTDYEPIALNQIFFIPFSEEPDFLEAYSDYILLLEEVSIDGEWVRPHISTSYAISHKIINELNRIYANQPENDRCKKALADCLLFLAKLEKEKGDFKKADKYLLAGLSIAKQINYQPSLGLTHLSDDKESFLAIADSFYNNSLDLGKLIARELLLGDVLNLSNELVRKLPVKKAILTNQFSLTNLPSGLIDTIYFELQNFNFELLDLVVYDCSPITFNLNHTSQIVLPLKDFHFSEPNFSIKFYPYHLKQTFYPSIKSALLLSSINIKFNDQMFFLSGADGLIGSVLYEIGFSELAYDYLLSGIKAAIKNWQTSLATAPDMKHIIHNPDYSILINLARPLFSIMKTKNQFEEMKEIYKEITLNAPLNGENYELTLKLGFDFNLNDQTTNFERQAMLDRHIYRFYEKSDGSGYLLQKNIVCSDCQPYFRAKMTTEFNYHFELDPIVLDLYSHMILKTKNGSSLSSLPQNNWLLRFGPDYRYQFPVICHTRKANICLSQYKFSSGGLINAVELEKPKDGEDLTVSEIEFFIKPDEQLTSTDFSIARWYKEINNPIGEIRILNKLVSENPHSSELCFYLGKAYFRAGFLDMTIQYLQKAVEINPQWKEPLYLLADIYRQNNIYPALAKTLYHLSTLEPRNKSLLKELSIVYQKIGDKTKQEEVQQKYDQLASRFTFDFEGIAENWKIAGEGNLQIKDGLLMVMPYVEAPNLILYNDEIYLNAERFKSIKMIMPEQFYYKLQIYWIKENEGSKYITPTLEMKPGLINSLAHNCQIKSVIFSEVLANENAFVLDLSSCPHWSSTIKEFGFLGAEVFLLKIDELRFEEKSPAASLAIF